MNYDPPPHVRLISYNTQIQVSNIARKFFCDVFLCLKFTFYIIDGFFLLFYSVAAFGKNESILILTFHVQQPGKHKNIYDIFLLLQLLHNRPIVWPTKTIRGYRKHSLSPTFKKDHLNHLTLVLSLIYVTNRASNSV